MSRRVLRLALLALAGASAGTASAAPEQATSRLAAFLEEHVVLAIAEPERPPEVVFERVRSHMRDADQEALLTVARGLQGPLRDGLLVFANRLEVVLEEVELEIARTPGARGAPAGSPLALLARSFRQAVAALLDERAPREHTIETLPDAVLERSVGRVVLRPLRARVVSLGRGVEVRADEATIGADTNGLELTGVTVTTASGDRLEAGEGMLESDGLLFVMSGYRWIGGRPGLGESATFAVSADGRRLVDRGPIPIGALRSTDRGPDLGAFEGVVELDPMLRGMFATRTARRGLSTRAP